jgi:hypothetical protein
VSIRYITQTVEPLTLAQKASQLIGMGISLATRRNEPTGSSPLVAFASCALRTPPSASLGSHQIDESGVERTARDAVVRK